MGTYDDSCGPSRGPIYFIGGDGSRWSAEIDRVIRPVRAVAMCWRGGYGISAAFREGLTARELACGRYSASPLGVPYPLADDLAGCWARAIPVGRTFRTSAWRLRTCWPPLFAQQTDHHSGAARKRQNLKGKRRHRVAPRGSKPRTQ
jgi:hypothetical protein